MLNLHPVLNFLRRLFRQPIKIQVVQRDVCRLTLDEWRSQQDMVKMATTALRTPEVRLMLDVLRNSHMGRMTAIGTMEQKAFHLCRCEGYRLALDNFEALGIFEKPKEQIEATFESPEESDTP